MELETHKTLVVDQRMQLSMLTQKLTENAEILEQKEEELRTMREKLLYDVHIHTYMYSLLITFIISNDLHPLSTDVSNSLFYPHR